MKKFFSILLTLCLLLSLLPGASLATSGADKGTQGGENSPLASDKVNSPLGLCDYFNAVQAGSARLYRKTVTLLNDLELPSMKGEPVISFLKGFDGVLDLGGNKLKIRKNNPAETLKTDILLLSKGASLVLQNGEINFPIRAEGELELGELKLLSAAQSAMTVAAEGKLSVTKSDFCVEPQTPGLVPLLVEDKTASVYIASATLRVPGEFCMAYQLPVGKPIEAYLAPGSQIDEKTDGGVGKIVSVVAKTAKLRLTEESVRAVFGSGARLSENNTTIKLNQDIRRQHPITIDIPALTLDLNGFSLSGPTPAMDGSFGIILGDGVTLTIISSSGKGKLIGGNGRDGRAGQNGGNGGTAVDVGNGAALIVEANVEVLGGAGGNGGKPENGIGMGGEGGTGGDGLVSTSGEVKIKSGGSVQGGDGGFGNTSSSGSVGRNSGGGGCGVRSLRGTVTIEGKVQGGDGAEGGMQQVCGVGGDGGDGASSLKGSVVVKAGGIAQGGNGGKGGNGSESPRDASAAGGSGIVSEKCLVEAMGSVLGGIGGKGENSGSQKPGEPGGEGGAGIRCTAKTRDGLVSRGSITGGMGGEGGSSLGSGGDGGNGGGGIFLQGGEAVSVISLQGGSVQGGVGGAGGKAKGGVGLGGGGRGGKGGEAIIPQAVVSGASLKKGEDGKSGDEAGGKPVKPGNLTVQVLNSDKAPVLVDETDLGKLIFGESAPETDTSISVIINDVTKGIIKNGKPAPGINSTLSESLLKQLQSGRVPISATEITIETTSQGNGKPLPRPINETAKPLHLKFIPPEEYEKLSPSAFRVIALHGDEVFTPVQKTVVENGKALVTVDCDRFSTFVLLASPGAVEVKATADSQGHAKVSVEDGDIAAAIQQLENQQGQGEKGKGGVSVDIKSDSPLSSFSAELKPNSIAKLAEKKLPLTIGNGDNEIVLKPEVLAQLQKVGGEALVSAGKAKDVSKPQQAALGGLPLSSISVKDKDGKQIPSMETAEIALPYTLKAGEKPEFVKVLSVDDSGNLSPAKSKWENGTVSAPLGKLQLYAIGYLPYTDIENHWAYGSIVYSHNNKLFSGVGNYRFAPDESMTRAMLWTVLYRMEKEPGKTETPPLWYSDAKAWAIAEKVSDGTSPQGSITREQLVTMLWRYADSRGMDVSPGEGANISKFEDFDKISEYAIPALKWACSVGVLQGKTDTELDPLGNATRAQVAAIFQRFLTK
ncbi:MAG: S-layer homology domain-containing protein [Oscillospiraceae bacterium]